MDAYDPSFVSSLMAIASLVRRRKMRRRRIIDVLPLLARNCSRVPVPINRNHMLIKAANMSAKVFKSHYRLSQEAVEILTSKIGPVYVSNIQLSGQPKTPIRKFMLHGLWFFGTTESYRQLGDRFDVERIVSFRMARDFTSFLNQMASEYIIWPCGELLDETRHSFDTLRKDISFPNVVGAVDGCHIRVSAGIDGESYYNRKKFPSVILQGTVDSKLRFIDVFAGWPGSSNDSRVWRNSELGKRLEQDPSRLIPEGCHLLGDAAYPLCPYLLTPYKDYGRLTEKQYNFNKKLSSTRIVVEQAFGLLLGRFRRLKFLDVKSKENTGRIILSACVLHNFCLWHNDLYQDVMERDLTDHLSECEECHFGLDHARLKRDEIADWLIERKHKKQKLNDNSLFEAEHSDESLEDELAY